jgi:hypothetical protein
MIEYDTEWVEDGCCGCGCLSSAAIYHLVMASVLLSALISSVVISTVLSGYRIETPVREITLDPFTGSITVGTLLDIPVDVLFWVAIGSKGVYHIVFFCFVVVNCRCNVDQSGLGDEDDAMGAPGGVCSYRNWFERRLNWARWGTTIAAFVSLDVGIGALCGLVDVMQLLPMLVFSLTSQTFQAMFEHAVTGFTTFNGRTIIATSTFVVYAFLYTVIGYSHSRITMPGLITSLLVIVGVLRLAEFVLTMVQWGLEVPNDRLITKGRKKIGDYMSWPLADLLHSMCSDAAALSTLVMLYWNHIRPLE